MYDYALSLIPL